MTIKLKIAFCFLGVMFLECEFSKNNLVSSGDIVVTSEELLETMGIEKGQALIHFSGDFTTPHDSNFWLNRFERGRPIDWLANHSIELLIEEKIRLALMSEYGILPIEFTSVMMMDSLNRLNAKLKLAKSKGNVIYGLSTYDMSTFKRHLLSNGVLEIQRRMKRSMSFEQEALKSKYDAVKSDLYALPLTYELIHVICKKEQGCEVLKEIRVGLFQQSVKDIMDSYLQSDKVEIKELQLELKSDNRRNDDYSGLINWARRLQKGQASPLFRFKNKPSFIYVLDAVFDRFLPIEEVESNVIDQLIQDEIDKIIRLKRKAVTVDVSRLKTTSYKFVHSGQ